MWTPRLYVLTWIFTGCACLVCGSIWGSEYSRPLYNSGQAWLGIAITAVYLSFGLQETAKENNDSKKEEDNVVNGHNNDNNDSGDDLIIENVSEENNAVTSSALLQTATSRSRFVKEKDGDDVEEGTLYSTGTKSNAYRNDDDDADDSDRSLFKSPRIAACRKERRHTMTMKNTHNKKRWNKRRKRNKNELNERDEHIEINLTRVKVRGLK